MRRFQITMDRLLLSLTPMLLWPIYCELSTAVAHILGHKYRILGHSMLCSIYETKNGFGKNMACL